MNIFDIRKDDLIKINDTLLEKLIARLCEAELAKYGYSSAYVDWSGSINSPDNGIDIHVKVPVVELSTGYIERPNIIFQAKKESMNVSKIRKEMSPNGKLATAILEQASHNGGYIIVSLGDDCSPKMKASRISTMRDILVESECSDSIYVDFYDRSKLAQWVRQHPSVLLWLKIELGEEYSGWRPYGSWSNPPHGTVDKLIFAPGIVINLPSYRESGLSIEEAINPMRELIKTTNKSIRITGLSGVGKTRFVQALFDEEIGNEALDKSIAIYADTGDELYPSPYAILNKLSAENQHAIMIIDNCSADMHYELTSKRAAISSRVGLITIEYDIKDDQPQETDVVYIEAVGPDLAEKLLAQRHPSIGFNNARRIAEFANGNARVSLAIAERVLEGGSLAQLSDAQLFNRLFEQRNPSSENLREQAELLSLVYSFSISPTENNVDELEILGNISGYTRNQLYRTINKLLNRHIVQKRGDWRAILPQAIANRLADSALNSFPVEQLIETFEVPEHSRLLMSFAHRLGMMGDHPVAKKIVEIWLEPEGVLGDLLALDRNSVRILSYIAPVAPSSLLMRFEKVIFDFDFKNGTSRFNFTYVSIINILVFIAYEDKFFDRCCSILIHLASCRYKNHNYNESNDPVKEKIKRFFQPYLSGTHASLDRRKTLMTKCLESDSTDLRSLGFEMLSTALMNSSLCVVTNFNNFGTSSRDFGYQPNEQQLVYWRSSFIDVAIQLATSKNTCLENPARQILADRFQDLWSHESMREKLITSSLLLHEYRDWWEGWKAVRSTIYLNQLRQERGYTSCSIPECLSNLSKKLEPIEIIPKVMAFVLGGGGDASEIESLYNYDSSENIIEKQHNIECTAQELGKCFAVSSHELNELNPHLFYPKRPSLCVAFGRGLAYGTCNIEQCWYHLVSELDNYLNRYIDNSVFVGFIDGVESLDHDLAQKLLDQSAAHPTLSSNLVHLHPRGVFSEVDFDRCMTALNIRDPHLQLSSYGEILWQDNYVELPSRCKHDLAYKLLCLPDGPRVILDALCMQLVGKNPNLDILGSDFRLIGLQASIYMLEQEHRDHAINDHNMRSVIASIFHFNHADANKETWLDAIFNIADNQYGLMPGFEGTIAITASMMPEKFLDRVFKCSNELRSARFCLLINKNVRSCPLDEIDVKTLIRWCISEPDIRVWEEIAMGITLWSDNDISKTAIEFLLAAPDPEPVMRVFSTRVEPTDWYDSPVFIMEERAKAIYALSDHQCSHIAKIAKVISDELMVSIHQKKEHYRKRKEKGQRFE